MESYRILYRVKVVHDYFDGKPCTAFHCRLTPQGELLARRRGLLFRQTAADEWALLFHAAPAESDVLTMDLFLADPAFSLYTAWEDFRPSATYELVLPASAESIEATGAILPTDRKRRLGAGFCTVALRLSEEMLEQAEAGKPMQSVLHFPAPSVRWEYLFVSLSSSVMKASQLALEDTTGTVAFSDFEAQTAYGREVYLTVSTSLVPMRETYGCRLRLTEREAGKRKRVLLSHVDFPLPGRFLNAGKGVIRQICYC